VLCSLSLYLDYVANITALHPNVAGRDPRNKLGSLENRRATMMMLVFENNSKPREQDFKDIKDLREYFD
jgi:hypothetical protein